MGTGENNGILGKHHKKYEVERTKITRLLVCITNVANTYQYTLQVRATPWKWLNRTVKAEAIWLCLLSKIWNCVMTNDNGGRRSGMNRRLFIYTLHVPELRSDNDRRSGIDRRCGVERRSTKRPEGDRRNYFTV